jgi:hypothetical protein
LHRGSSHCLPPLLFRKGSSPNRRRHLRHHRPRRRLVLSSHAILLLFLAAISKNARPSECCQGSCKCRPALRCRGKLSDVITKISCGQEQQTTRPADRATMLVESATTVVLWAVRVCAHMVHCRRSTHQLSRPSLTVGQTVYRACTASTMFLLLWKERNFGGTDGLPRRLTLLQMRSNRDQQPTWSGMPA